MSKMLLAGAIALATVGLSSPSRADTLEDGCILYIVKSFPPHFQVTAVDVVAPNAEFVAKISPKGVDKWIQINFELTLANRKIAYRVICASNPGNPGQYLTVHLAD